MIKICLKDNKGIKLKNIIKIRQNKRVQANSYLLWPPKYIIDLSKDNRKTYLRKYGAETAAKIDPMTLISIMNQETQVFQKNLKVKVVSISVRLAMMNWGNFYGNDLWFS